MLKLLHFYTFRQKQEINYHFATYSVEIDI